MTPSWRGSCWVHRICGGLGVQPVSSCPTHSQVLRILAAERGSGVSLGVFHSLPLKHPQEAPDFNFWASPRASSKWGVLKLKSVSLLSCSEASQGKVIAHIRVTRPWAIGPSPIFSSVQPKHVGLHIILLCS